MIWTRRSCYNYTNYGHPYECSPAKDCFRWHWLTFWQLERKLSQSTQLLNDEMLTVYTAVLFNCKILRHLGMHHSVDVSILEYLSPFLFAHPSTSLLPNNAKTMVRSGLAMRGAFVPWPWLTVTASLVCHGEFHELLHSLLSAVNPIERRQIHKVPRGFYGSVRYTLILNGLEFAEKVIPNPDETKYKNKIWKI